MKKYFIPLILIFVLFFVSIGNCAWLSGYDQRIKLTTDNTKINSVLSNFPVTIFFTSAQGEEIFTEFDADSDYMKCAFTSSDGTTQLYAEKELFDDSEQKAIYHVKVTSVASGVDTDIYYYYDNDHADNTTYIGAIVPFRPLVTFVFDDGCDTNLSIKTLFDTQGEVACAAIVTDWVGNENKLTWTNINTLQTAGWEIVNHTKTHTNLTTLNEAQIITELEGSISAFSAQGFEPNSLALPYGATNALVRSVSAEYFRSARAIGSPWVNPQIIDVYALAARSADDHTAIATYKADVDTAKAGNRWVIFYMHVTDENDETMLDELIDYIQAEGVDIVTMNQALDVFLGSGAGVNVWDKYFKAVHHEVDITTSTIKDSTSNNNNGTKKAANEPVEAAGQVGQAQDFDGTDDEIHIADSADFAFNAFTMELIINPDVTTGRNVAIQQYDVTSTDGFKIRHFDDPADIWEFSVHVGGVVKKVESNSAPTGSAEYMACTRDGDGLMSMYLDGVAQTDTETNAGTIDSSGNIYLGCDYAEDKHWAGIQDEVRFSNTNRSDAWIKATYNSLWDTLLTYNAEETEEEEDNAIFFGTNF